MKNSKSWTDLDPFWTALIDDGSARGAEFAFSDGVLALDEDMFGVGILWEERVGGAITFEGQSSSAISLGTGKKSKL